MGNVPDGAGVVGLFGHGGAGKTTLGESLLHCAGVTDRLGRVTDGTSVLARDPEEQHRGITLALSAAWLPVGNRVLTLVDTPGYPDFEGDVLAAAAVVDAGILVVDATVGIQAGTERAAELLRTEGVPVLSVATKADREARDFHFLVEELAALLHRPIVPLLVPAYKSQRFAGIVDVLKGESEGEVSPEQAEEIRERWRSRAVEEAAAAEEGLLESFLAAGDLLDEEVLRGLKLRLGAGEVCPLLTAVPSAELATARVLRYLLALMPSPRVLVDEDGHSVPCTRDGSPTALVFKTVADPYLGRLSLARVQTGLLVPDVHLSPAGRSRDERVSQVVIPRGRQQVPGEGAAAGTVVGLVRLQDSHTGDTLSASPQMRPLRFPRFPEPTFRMAVRAAGKGDEDRLMPALARLCEEDPALRVAKAEQTGELLLCGYGELHLQVALERLARKFNVRAHLDAPRVPYREALRGRARAEGKYKKQTGGHGQYGHVWLEIEPLPDGEFEFVDRIFGGVVPQVYRPAVEKGVREAMREGVLAGYPVTGVRVTLVDGSYHPVDSSELAFKIAGAMAFKKGAAQAFPVLLEPVWEVVVTLPEAYVGDVIHDLTRRRARVLGMEGQPGTGLQVVRAHVPESELLRYTLDLRSLTQGRGRFTARMDHYQEVPPHVTAAVVASASRAEG